jgi:uncharacterized protein YciI
MPYFAIHCIDKPHSAQLRAATRPEHMSYLQAVDERILAAGPLLDLEGQPMGSLLIIDFPDRAAAYRFAAADPYALAGLFASVAVTSWRRVFPADAG